MEAQPVDSQPGKNNRTVVIVAIVIVVLLCCCIVLAVAAFFGLKSFQANRLLQPNVPTLVPGSGAGNPPQGGLTDNILRNDTWQYVSAAASAFSCNGDGSQSSIDVTQQPDSGGVWVERWTVACQGGGEEAFDVTFTPSSGGGTDFVIKHVQ